MLESPKKIVVVGVSAAGKSTFGRKLAEKLGIKLVLMDEIMWNPGWEYIGDEKTADHLAEVSGQSEWIIEGYITTAARSNLFDKADQILYLDYPGYLSAWRYIKRCVKYRKNPRPELPSSPDKFKLKTLKLIYTRGEVWRLEKLFKENDWNNKIIRFKTPKEAEKYLNSTINRTIQSS